MNTPIEEPLLLAHRPVHGSEDAIRRYCGLSWSGGGPEVWAYAYYDAVETDPQTLAPSDVTAAAALHPSLSRGDLEFFANRRADFEAWLAATPGDVQLADASDDDLAGLDPFGEVEGVSLALLTKVLHRKRPHLVPLVDRHVLDWYRPVTGERAAVAAWRPLLRALRDDLRTNASTLAALTERLGADMDTPPSQLRCVDIALWMGGHR